MSMNKHGQQRVKVLVWDLPTRLFHWSLVALITTAWFTSGSQYLHVHVFAGYTILGLLGFRLLWGFVGEFQSRFSSFRYRWSEVLDYFRDFVCGRPKAYVGHNPLGSWSVYALLGGVLAVSLSGLFVLGGEEQQGPLSNLLGFRAGETAHGAHELLAWALLLLVAVHVLGVLTESLLHRSNLIGAMVSGRKKLYGRQLSDVSTKPRYGTAYAMVGLMAAGAASYFSGYFLQTPEHPYLPFGGPELADNETWREECGSCHLAFHPSLLPQRSWERMLTEQDNHFGDDLALMDETMQELQAFFRANAAETEPTEAAYKINRAVPATQAPLRITETVYWKRKHDGIAEAIWDSPLVQGRADCGACHRDAEQGTFADGAMGVPAVAIRTLPASRPAL